MCSPNQMDSAQASGSPKRKKPSTKPTVEPIPGAAGGDGDSKFARALGSRYCTAPPSWEQAMHLLVHVSPNLLQPYTMPEACLAAAATGSRAKGGSRLWLGGCPAESMSATWTCGRSGKASSTRSGIRTRLLSRCGTPSACFCPAGAHACTNIVLRRMCNCGITSGDTFLVLWRLSDCLAGLQGALADRLSAVLTQLSPDVAHTYFTVFLRALREEWFGIDRLRLDKFMLLIRRMLRQLFRRLHSASWCGWPAFAIH